MREALERVAVWALRYSPIVAADSPDGWSSIRPAPATAWRRRRHAADMIVAPGSVRHSRPCGDRGYQGCGACPRPFAARPGSSFRREKRRQVKPLPIAALRFRRIRSRTFANSVSSASPICWQPAGAAHAAVRS